LNAFLVFLFEIQYRHQLVLIGFVINVGNMAFNFIGIKAVIRKFSSHFFYFTMVTLINLVSTDFLDLKLQYKNKPKA
jgi:hypothetical protein